MRMIYWISGFTFNAIYVLWHLIPMSITMGDLCYRNNRPMWDIAEDELMDEVQTQLKIEAEDE
jgi:hypothetical protein